MSLSENAGTQTGFATVVATEGRGLNPKELSDLTIAKVIRISSTANPVIKQQAEAFKEQLEAILVRAFKQAQMSERTTLYNLFKNQGHEDMAEIIKRL
jgi:1-acyl-sn-glycerol-3-phosphate acyltransferase